MLNVINPVFLVIEPLIFYFPSAPPCVHHLFQVLLCQLNIAQPSECNRLFCLAFSRFISIAEQVGYFPFPCCFFYMVDIFPAPSFFSDPADTDTPISPPDPFIALTIPFAPLKAQTRHENLVVSLLHVVYNSLRNSNTLQNTGGEVAKFFDPA